MYTLYYSPGACSMAVHIVLNEIGVPFTLENTAISEGKTRSPEFLSINPQGQVPVLVDGKLVVREGGAILVYLLEKHQSPLLPAAGNERAVALEWLMFCNSTLHPAYGRVFFLLKNGGSQQSMDAAIKHINKLWEGVEKRLEQHDYLAGDTLTAADILMTVIANWSLKMPQPIILGPRTKQLLRKIIALPSCHKALETEKIEYKAAA